VNSSSSIEEARTDNCPVISSEKKYPADPAVPILKISFLLRLFNALSLALKLLKMSKIRYRFKIFFSYKFTNRFEGISYPVEILRIPYQYIA
jgi:hypothetical protein